MSDASATPPPPPNTPPPESYSRPPQPRQRNGCLTVIMMLAGIIMLLPGLCALIFGALVLSHPAGADSIMLPLVLIGLLVGFCGIMLIRTAIKVRRSRV